MTRAESLSRIGLNVFLGVVCHVPKGTLAVFGLPMFTTSSHRLRRVFATARTLDARSELQLVLHYR